MIGVGWPIEDFPPGGAGHTELWAGILGFVVLIALSALVIWRDRRAVRMAKARPELRIEHPAEFRKAA